MAKLTETVSTINSAVRTFLAVVVVGSVGTASYFVYEKIYTADRELEETRELVASTQLKLDAAERQVTGLRVEVSEKQARIDRLETAMHLLKTDRRLALLEVLDQQRDAETEQVQTTIRFTELSPEGEPIDGGKEFVLDGEVIYLDNWVVKFADDYVENADLQRGTSLALFRRVFGEFQSPSEAEIIDEVGTMPQAYQRGGVPTEFEQEIWDDFWTFANDPELAKEKGIRAAHGEALSMKVAAGNRYRVVLRASDGLSIVPEPKIESTP